MRIVLVYWRFLDRARYEEN